MKNCVFTSLFCSDSKKLSKIIGRMSFKDSEIDSSVFEETEVVNIFSYNDAPYEEIRALSINYPGITFTACYTFEADDWYTCFYVDFINGTIKESESSISYTLNVNDAKNYYRGNAGNNFTHLLDRAVDFFSRLDSPKINDSGRIYLDFPDEVTMCVDDGKYVLEITRYGNQIDIKEFCPLEEEAEA